MSEILSDSKPHQETRKKAALWPMALVILAIVFIPALLAWMISLVAG